MLETLLYMLVAASWIYWLVAWWATRAFFQTRPEADPGLTPPVSILKPVKGLDAQVYQNYASFCRQDYPTFELLFGVADPQDPVFPILKRLQQGFPEYNIRLITGEAMGSNRKASLLHHLAAQARHEVLVISDSDMQVSPDYLRRVVAPLADEQIGLVTCPYRGGAPSGLAAQLGALHMGVTFLPSAVVASQLFRMPLAMGATMALRRGDLSRMGGFEAIADYLADDYQLGARVARLGKRVHVSTYVTTSILGKTTFCEQWRREVRWARCTRVSRPWEYPGLLLTFSTPLALILLPISGFAAVGWLALTVSLLLRWAVGWWVTGYTRDEETRRWLIWLPLRDVLSALVWCTSIMGRSIYWRGEQFALKSDGRMQPRPSPVERSFGERHAW
jgi:ceramide glucosyltransferase